MGIGQKVNFGSASRVFMTSLLLKSDTLNVKNVLNGILHWSCEVKPQKQTKIPFQGALKA